MCGGEVHGGAVHGQEVHSGEVRGREVRGGEVRGGEVRGGEVCGGEVRGVEVQGVEVHGGEVHGGELGRMLKLASNTYSRNIRAILLWLIYMCIGVMQTLWFLNLLIRQAQSVFLFPAEPSTVYGGSSSSACSIKALVFMLAVNRST